MITVNPDTGMILVSAKDAARFLAVLALLQRPATNAERQKRPSPRGGVLPVSPGNQFSSEP